MVARGVFWPRLSLLDDKLIREPFDMGGLIDRTGPGSTIAESAAYIKSTAFL
jgi:hypothetical protein